MVYPQSPGSGAHLRAGQGASISPDSWKMATFLGLYNACDCFVFPSFYEGFGLPILEAMACGRAVACSGTSAMPEVADGAGFIFDPANKEDMMRSMADILLDPELRGRMERLGLQRAAQFTWQKSARATIEVYREVAAERREIRLPVPVRSMAGAHPRP